MNVHGFLLLRHLEHETEQGSESPSSRSLARAAASHATRDLRHSSQLENWVRRVTSSLCIVLEYRRVKQQLGRSWWGYQVALDLCCIVAVSRRWRGKPRSIGEAITNKLHCAALYGATTLHYTKGSCVVRYYI